MRTIDGEEITLISDMEWSSGAIKDVLAERKKQVVKWGKQQVHSPEIWLAILSEEVGELSQAMLHYRYAEFPEDHLDKMRVEAVQVAAVALAIVEALNMRNSVEFRSRSDE